jgi:hypothetical protein
VNATRLDRVFTFEDQLSFLIPHEWIEGDDEGSNYLYHAPDTDSGWFRASLLTLKNTSREKLRELFNEKAMQRCGDLCETGDNLIVAWKQISEQDGISICNYWWAVGHSSGPTLCHEALFSYTILHERLEEPETQEALSLVGKLVADATFAAPKIA